MSKPKIQWFDFSDLWMAPGKWGQDFGYVYAMFFEDGDIKVGSSVNPRCRVQERWQDGHGAKVAIVPVGLNFRRSEKAFHFAMRRYAVAVGMRPKSEIYPVKSRKLRSAIISWLESGAKRDAVEGVYQTAVAQAKKLWRYA